MKSSTIVKPKSFFLAAFPLFLVILIDSMGLGLVFPILNALVLDPSAHFIMDGLSSNARNIVYGFTIGIFMFCWFFGAAFLGDLSDQIGRKKSLLICLIGGFIGYLISALGVVFRSYTLLLGGRMIAGFTSGSQSIAQAAIVDISQPEHKARNLGLILFFSSLGFVIGPMVGGVLSHYFNYSMPLYFAAAISLLNAFLLMWLFHETFLHVEKVNYKIYHAVEIFISAFKNEKVRELSIVMLVMIFGWSSFYSFISMYLLRVYHFTSLQNGCFMGLMGTGFGIGTGFLVEPLTKRFSLSICVIGSCILSALGIITLIYANSEIMAWCSVLLVAIPIAVAYSTLITLFSNQVDEDSQGWVMGITGSIMAFVFGLNGLLLGILADVSPNTPMLIAACGLVLSALLMKLIFKENHKIVP